MNQLTIPTRQTAIAAVPQANDSRAVLLLLAHTLRCWWLLAMTIGALAAVSAAALVFNTFQPEFRASVWLQIYSQAPYVVFPGKDDSRQFIENQTQLIRSRLVLGALLTDPSVASVEELAKSSAIIDELASRLAIRPLGKSEYFAVEYRGIDRDTSKHVVEQVVQSYMALQNDDDTKHRTALIELLTSEKTVREKKVEDIRKALALLVEESIGAEGQTTAYSEEQMSNLAELRKKLVTIDVESAILQIEIAAFDRSTRSVPVSVDQVIENAVDDHLQVVALEREINSLEEKIAGYKSQGMGANHPSRQREKDELNRRTLQLASMRERISKRQVQTVQNARETERSIQLSGMQSRLNSYRITKEVLERHVANETQSVKKSSGNSLQVEFLRAELSQATLVLNLLAKRLQEMQTEQRAPARVRLMEAGGLAVVPVETLPYKKMAVASAAAFGTPFALFFLLELMLRRVSKASQLETIQQVPVVGEIANLRKAWLDRHLHPRRWRLEQHLYRESVDQLRTLLTCKEGDSEQDCYVISINSAISGEGKSSLALQLAMSLASASTQRVLLIDGDMRNPDSHLRLKTNLSPGLCDVLSKRVSLKHAVRKSAHGGPYFLPAGKLTSSPIHLMGDGELEKMIASLRRSFRYIVIDTPPVLSACEALVMASVADMFLLCTRRDRSRMHLVRAAHDRLVSAGATCIGTVLTGVPVRSYTSRYGVYPLPGDLGLTFTERQKPSRDA
jgi:polysaccharide biosynthesis transport protein